MNPTQAAFLVALAAVFVFVVIVVVPRYMRRARAEMSRAERIKEVASSLGLSYSSYDPVFPGSMATRYPFELFSRGHQQVCENVVSGKLGGRQVTGFDFLYRDGDSPALRVSCAIVEIGGSVPHILIAPASIATDLPLEHDGTRVPLEWGAFNARYHLYTPERGYAPAILDVPLMAWLVDEAPPLAFTWEVQRGFVLCRGRGLAPEAFADLLRATVEFARRVPGAATT
jgi:hypothetical protein